MKTTQHYLIAAGLAPYVRDVGPLEDLAERNAALLSYGAPDFSGERARVYVRALLAGE